MGRFKRMSGSWSRRGSSDSKVTSPKSGEAEEDDIAADVYDDETKSNEDDGNKSSAPSATPSRAQTFSNMSECESLIIAGRKTMILQRVDPRSPKHGLDEWEQVVKDRKDFMVDTVLKRRNPAGDDQLVNATPERLKRFFETDGATYNQYDLTQPSWVGGQLPPGWTAHKSRQPGDGLAKGTGEFYYTKDNSGETTWSFPLSPLHEEWVEEIGLHGAVSYVNVRTGEWSWDRPVDPVFIEMQKDNMPLEDCLTSFLNNPFKKVSFPEIFSPKSSPLAALTDGTSPSFHLPGSSRAPAALLDLPSPSSRAPSAQLSQRSNCSNQLQRRSASSPVAINASNVQRRQPRAPRPSTGQPPIDPFALAYQE